MNKPTIIDLADKLETLDRKDFHLDHWAQAKKGWEFPPNCEVALTPCRTVACAGGWAVQWFGKELELQLVSDEDGDVTIDTRQPHRAEGVIELAEGVIKLLAESFAISYQAAYHLFLPSHYSNKPSPKQVARRIRKMDEVGFHHWSHHHCFYCAYNK